MRSSWIHWIGLCIVLLLTVLAYSNSFQAAFHFDDSDNIVDNLSDHLNILSLSELKRVFSQKRPVAHLSFALNYYYGDLNVYGYHIVNLLLHLMTVAILYQLILVTLSLPIYQKHYKSATHRIAFIASFLWAIHPLQTQAVTYIVQRMTVMAAFFYLLSLLSYVKGRLGVGETRFLWYGISLMAIFLGLGSKQTVAVAPVFIGLYEICFLSHSGSRVIRRALFFPFSVILIIMAIVGLYYLDWTSGAWGALSTFFTASYMGDSLSFTFTERLLTESRVMLHYLSLIFFPLPSRLNLDYDYLVSHSIWDPLTTLPSLLFVGGTLGYAFFRARRQPLVSYCILWFYGNLLIESVLFKLDLVFEHRLYLPSIAIMVLMAVGIDRFWYRVAERAGWMGRGVLAGAGIGILVLLGLWTFQRNAVWRTDITLWEDTVQKSPQKARPNEYLGYAYMIAGRLDQAAYHFQEALKFSLDEYSASLNLAGIYAKQGKLELAMEMVQKVVQNSPSRYLGHYNLANLYISGDQSDLAIREYEETLRLNPRYIPAYVQLGQILEERGQTEKAIKNYKVLAEMDPLSEKPHAKLGQALLKLGNYKGARESYTEAIGLNPGNFNARYNLAWIYQQEGVLDKALKEYRECLRLDSSNPEAHNNLGVIYMSLGSLDMGIKEFEDALGFRPDYIEARYNLARALQLTGRKQQAILEYKKLAEGISAGDLRNPFRQEAIAALTNLLKEGPGPPEGK